MIDVRDNNYIDRSPCLSCPHRDMDKNKCSMLCLRLAAYSSGEPWEGKPLPYIAKQKKEAVKMEEKDARPEGTEAQRDRGTKSNIVGAGLSRQQPANQPAVLAPVAADNKVCVMCHDPDKKILNKRSQTCVGCYQQWNTGKKDHPTLGKFTPILIKSKITKTPGKAKAKKPKTESTEEIIISKVKEEEEPDKISHGEKHMSKDPKASYYDAGGIETLEIIRAKLTPEQYQGYLLGCSLKYQCRLMHKADNNEERIRDAEKASNYSLWLLEFFKLSALAPLRETKNENKKS